MKQTLLFCALLFHLTAYNQVTFKDCVEISAVTFNRTGTDVTGRYTYAHTASYSFVYNSILSRWEIIDDLYGLLYYTNAGFNTSPAPPVKSSSNWAGIDANTNCSNASSLVIGGADAFTVVLPVSWLSFTAEVKNNSVQLNWSTAQETNSSEFKIQYSNDGISWTTIGNVGTAGNSAVVRGYAYIHANPIAGNNYYRILQTDLDGKSSYSETRKVQYQQNETGFRIIENPVSNGRLNLQIFKPGTVSLYDANGKLILQKQAPAGQLFISMNGYSKGVYFVKADNKVQKFVLQ